jgi:hypothetical protein
MKIRASSVLVVLGMLALAAGTSCNSDTEDVCQDIGDCSQGGSSTWIASCQAEAKALGKEADGVSCGAVFDGYFSCARENYSCRGATAVFPGCDDRLAALDACLTAATAGTSCARLEAAAARCAGGGDGGTDATTGAGTPPACTAARNCQANCYLAGAAETCAPRVDELEAITACASSCVP